MVTDFELKSERRFMEERRKEIDDHIFDTVPLVYSNYAIRTDEGEQQ